MKTKNVVIIGGGFAGIQTALDLDKYSKSSEVSITLVSNREDFEYYPALHTFLSVSGTADYVSVPLKEIFKKTRVELIIDTVVDCNLDEKKITLATGGEKLGDYLVFATGSESTFFGISGLSEMAFPFQNIADAKKLKIHIEQSFNKNCISISEAGEKTECVIGLNFVVIGGGPNGVDLAGELASYTKKLCTMNSVSESLITIHLVEGAPTVLPMMLKKVQIIAEKRLRRLGVNILCNRQLLKQDEFGVELSDMKLGAKTVIWTAGTTGNNLTTKIPGVILQKKNRITLDEYLQIQDFKNCFAIGDIGDTQYSGLAQTAIHNGSYVAKKITADMYGKEIKPYKPKTIAYNIGIGHGWSVMQVGKFVVAGKVASLVRTLINMKYFFSILPFTTVIKLFVSKKKPLS